MIKRTCKFYFRPSIYYKKNMSYGGQTSAGQLGLEFIRSGDQLTDDELKSILSITNASMDQNPMWKAYEMMNKGTNQEGKGSSYLYRKSVSDTTVRNATHRMKVYGVWGESLSQAALEHYIDVLRHNPDIVYQQNIQLQPQFAQSIQSPEQVFQLWQLTGTQVLGSTNKIENYGSNVNIHIVRQGSSNSPMNVHFGIQLNNFRSTFIYMPNKKQKHSRGIRKNESRFKRCSR